MTKKSWQKRQVKDINTGDRIRLSGKNPQSVWSYLCTPEGINIWHSPDQLVSAWYPETAWIEIWTNPESPVSVPIRRLVPKSVLQGYPVIPDGTSEVDIRQMVHRAGSPMVVVEEGDGYQLVYHASVQKVRG